MAHNNLQKIAHSIKENRIQKKYTQKDLAEISGISLRSIQRLENAEVIPRHYTLNILAKHLGFSIEQETPVKKPSHRQLKTVQKTILSISLASLLVLLASAYVFQSPTFPENEFELSLYIAAFICLYTIIILVIWK
jgi:transcriptional regulator with XRE-family HTH domain